MGNWILFTELKLYTSLYETPYGACVVKAWADERKLGLQEKVCMSTFVQGPTVSSFYVTKLLLADHVAAIRPSAVHVNKCLGSQSNMNSDPDSTTLSGSARRLKVWSPFAVRAAEILQMYHRPLETILRYFFQPAVQFMWIKPSHSCYSSVSCTSMMGISHRTMSQRRSNGFRSCVCGVHWSKVNSLCSVQDDVSFVK